MTWRALEVTREPVPWTGDEPTMLSAFLDFHRLVLRRKCAGLTAEQLAARTAEPSPLSLLGLVRHMAEVERAWFRRGLASEPAGPIYCTPDKPDADFEEAAAATAQQDFATYQREVELARKAAAGRAPDETFRQRKYDVDLSLRWVYLHMIREYARHNGHADLIRERIDGTTG
jgi:uncharacterized damage-inducible protein DinB